MKPFRYERASTPAAAAAAAAGNPDAKFIAGGTNLLDLMKLEIEKPAHLIDVNGLALDKIELATDGGLKIGALVRNTDLAGDARGGRAGGGGGERVFLGGGTTRSVFAPTEAGEGLVSAVGPHFEDIRAALDAMGALRDKPSGNVRITAGLHVTETILWPKLRPTWSAPEVKVEIIVDYGLANIVADRFDAGVHLGEQDRQGHGGRRPFRFVVSI